MKTHLVSLSAILLFWLEACTTPYVLTPDSRPSPYWQTPFISYDELNKRWEGDKIRIVLVDGNEKRGRFVHVDSAGVSWIGKEFSNYQNMSMSNVRQVSFSRNYAWEGAGAGFLIVAGSMVWSGAWAPATEGMNPPRTVYPGRYFTVLGGVAGAFLGAIGGSLITQTDEIQVVHIAGPGTLKRDSTK